ncbi:GDSL-type esterase/lipase family protein [Enterobacter cloacae]|uniref:GDSL-type esterase/lipase family protein n=1 Tax=Enterobacter cloacae TaxID=550 RepID=UPI002874C5A5|nr:GDSL-type esterase/lipase family protein [Enterobacter cloacae]MDR9972590.1 GDSL-type esterase/lipase family protein [Enterobacter cloacae subsp. cloacae]
MTVSTVVYHNDYTGNGVTTSFPYTFRIFKQTDLAVSVVDLDENITVLVLDADYTVTNAGGYNGGNVVLTTPLANGWQISITRELEPTQETDLRNQGKFFAEVHEDAFDKLTMLIQQALYKIGMIDKRAIKAPEIGNWFVPRVQDRKNKLFAWNDSGSPIAVLPPSGSATDVMIELAKPTGAGLIGTSDGKTVQQKFDWLDARPYNSNADIGSRLASGESIKIVVYGDSTVDGTNTTGWTANPTDALGNAIGGTDHNIDAPNTWPVYMQTILRDMFGNSVTVKNAGYGGKTIIDNWAINNYQKAVVDTYGTPDYVLLSFGLNDVVQGIYTTDLYYQRYGELIDAVFNSGAVPVVITSDPVSFNTSRTTLRVQGELIKAQRYIASKLGVQCIDINAGLVGWQNNRNSNDRWAFHQNDGLHFSDLGHFKKAELSVLEISGLVVSTTKTTKVAPWQARQNVYPNTIFRSVNNFFSGCLNYSNQNAVSVLTLYLWSDRKMKLNYHSVDRDVSSSSSSTVYSKITKTNLRTGVTVDVPVYFGDHAVSASNRMSELPLDCGTLDHGITKVEYTTAPLGSGTCSVGFFSVTEVGPKTVHSIGRPTGTTYAIDADMFEMDNVLSYTSGAVNSIICQLNVPKFFGALLTKCRTFNNSGDVTLSNQQSCLLVYRETDDAVGLYLVTYNSTSGIAVSLLAKSSASVYVSGISLEIRTGLSSGQQVVQVYNGSTQIINYTHPSASQPLPVGGVAGGIFANKALASGADMTGYASITFM